MAIIFSPTVYNILHNIDDKMTNLKVGDRNIRFLPGKFRKHFIHFNNTVFIQTIIISVISSLVFILMVAKDIKKGNNRLKT